MNHDDTRSGTTNQARAGGAPTTPAPTILTPETLTLAPYGVSVFTDLKRGKSFVTLLFRREGLTLPRVGDFLADAYRAAGGAGLTMTEAAKITLKQTEEGYRCHLEVAVQLAGGRQAELLAFADALRASGRKTDAEATDAGKEAG